MPKRHRQPEPIEIRSAAHRSPSHLQQKPNTFTQSQTAVNASSPLRGSGNGTSTSIAAAAAEFSPGELKVVEETRRKAMDFPATPDTLARHRRQQEADAKRRRVSYDHEGQPVTGSDGGVAAPLPLPTANAAAATGSPSGVPDEEEEEAFLDDSSDLSSNNYIGDDGNQPSSDSGMDSDEDNDDASELRGLRMAMKAAAAQRQRNAGGGGKGQPNADSTDSSSEWDGEEEDDDDEEGDSDSTDDAAAAALGDSEEDSDEEEDSAEGSESASDAPQGSEEEAEAGDDEDDDDDDEEEEGGLITVDFGVFDMEASNIDGVIHLMDQLCPDKMNEVDRDDLGLALYESPFTSVVRLQNNGEDTNGDEAQEFYGLSSVLDVAHGQQLYPKALRPFCDLLQQHVWRQAASGIPPTDILTSVVDDEGTPSARAKCLLLISEYIRNIPLELTVQILEDVLDRLDAAGKAERSTQKANTGGATHDNPIYATHPSMFAVLAKVQRATDAPVTLPRSAATTTKTTAAQQQQGGEAGSQPNALSSSSAAAAAAGKRRGHNAKRSEKAGAAAGNGSGAMAAPEAPLDLAHYIFWREEDGILFEFRDKRVAALVYRCRPQYDMQPEHEIPLSILFVLQYGAVRQAVEEMKRRQTVNASIERY